VGTWAATDEMAAAAAVEMTIVAVDSFILFVLVNKVGLICGGGSVLFCCEMVRDGPQRKAARCGGSNRQRTTAGLSLCPAH